MKNLLDDMKNYGRFAFGLRDFLHRRISPAEAQAIVQRRMIERDTNFLRLMEKGIFGYSKSPYRPLLKLAGCELGDLRNMVRARGLEGTLHELREAGVYITFEEFKGRKPLVRNGKTFNIRPRQFDNPHLIRHYHATTGGTTGPGTRIEIDLDHLEAIAPHFLLEHLTHGALNTPTGIWFGPLPDPTAVVSILTRSCYGEIPAKWFSPVSDHDPKPPLKYRLASKGIIIAGRLFGVPIPRPEPVRLDQAVIIARWATKMVEDHGACLITTHVSKALRICIAALEEGLDLTHVTMVGGGEPPSPVILQVMNRTGARWVPKYFLNEVGAVGLACAQPVDQNDVHFLKDALALIQCPRQVPGTEITVQAFNFTTLLPSAPKLLLNVESDDYGIIETRSCGCPLEAYGYTEHLRKIYSFSKLTGEGVTLVGSEMLRILEEVLPSRFGGSPLDYQLLEELDQKGFTRLRLIVSPKIHIRDESEVIETVLEAMKQTDMAMRLASELWKQAATLRVKRQEPVWTAGGKFMPLHKTKLSQTVTRDESS